MEEDTCLSFSIMYQPFYLLNCIFICRFIPLIRLFQSLRDVFDL